MRQFIAISIVVIALFALALALIGCAAPRAVRVKPPPVPTTNTFVWRYPAGVNPYNYWWDISASRDLKQWQTIVTNASGVQCWTNSRTDNLKAFRLQQKLLP